MARARRSFRLLWPICGLLVLLACPSRTRLDSAAQSALRDDYLRQHFFLRQSLYYGPFYDDAKRILVDAHAFSELKLMTAPDGDIIVPPPPEGIVPAGTEVEASDLEFPTSAVIVRRPLFTPRYNIWLKLKVVGDPSEREHVLVLPSAIRSPESIRASLEALLSAKEITSWLAARSPSARLAIEEKRVEKGMTYEETLAAMGLPDDLHRRFEGTDRVEALRYGQKQVTLHNGTVTRIEVRSPPDDPSPATEPGAP